MRLSGHVRPHAPIQARARLMVARVQYGVTPAEKFSLGSLFIYGKFQTREGVGIDGNAIE